MCGEMADALLLSSQRVESALLQTAGYLFKYAQLEGALRRALKDSKLRQAFGRGFTRINADLKRERERERVQQLLLAYRFRVYICVALHKKS